MTVLNFVRPASQEKSPNLKVQCTIHLCTQQSILKLSSMYLDIHSGLLFRDVPKKGIWTQDLRAADYTS